MLSPVKIWRNQKNVANLIGSHGRIISWTIIRTPPTDFMDQAPYPVVIVELSNKKRMTAQLVDWEPDNLQVGQVVITVVRRVMQTTTDSLIPYGIKVKPYGLT